MIFSNGMSFKNKIKIIAKEVGLTPQQVQQNYLIETFLSKLSKSKHKDDFIVKGGYLIASMIGLGLRSTMDLDATIKGFELTYDSLERVIEDIIQTPTNDSFSFELKSIGDIRETDDYPGFRVKINATFERISEIVTLDITTGDVITPKEIRFMFPMIFEDIKLELFAYPMETILAEKLETILSRGIGSTRPRDYYDVYILSKLYLEHIDYEVLYEALINTQKKRQSVFEINNYSKTLNNILNSKFQQELWSKYQKQYQYATKTSFKEVMNAIENLMSKIMNRKKLVKEMNNFIPINSFDELMKETRINPVAYDFKLNALGDDLYTIVSNCDTYIDFMFEYNKLKAIDRDRCTLARDIYNKMYGIEASKEEYAGVHDWSYDTINTFQTTYQQAVSLYCNELFKKCRIGEFDVETKGHKRISRMWLTKVHKELVEKVPAYKDMNNLEYIQQFAHWTHTLGNFVLVPFYYRNNNGYIRSLNGFRGTDANIKDYFDLSVNAVFESFNLMSRISSSKIIEDFEVDYVKKFYMDDYFLFEGDGVPVGNYLFSREKGSPLPKTKEDLKKCILEMIIRIINRGKIITSSDKCQKSFLNFMDEEKYQKLIQAYKECATVKLCESCNSKCIIKEAYIEFTV